MRQKPFRTAACHRSFAVVLASLALLVGTAALSRAQPPGVDDLLATQRLTFEEVKSGPAAKLGRDLAALAREVAAHERSGSGVPFASGNLLLPIADERIAIDAVAVSGGTDALREALEALGLERGASFGPLVSGWMPVRAVAAMAGLAELRSARPAYFTRKVGDTTSQGDPAMTSDDSRSTFGIDGTGVTVGTLSDSYDCLGGAAGDVTSGDLPGGVVVLMDACPGGTDEGRGMMQLIGDVAPGASQAFHTAGPGQAGFATGILALQATAGAEVIVDDILYLAEPMFQDGVVAQAVDTVVAAGASFFSAAGNNARDAHEDDYRPGVDPVFSLASHDWDPGAGTDFYQSLTIPPGSSIIVVFQWDQPYASATGGSGSANDVDIYLLDDPPTTALAAGIDDNLMTGEPIEVFSFDNATSLSSFNLYINLFAGPAPSFFKYVLFAFEGTVNEFFASSGTIYGHGNAAGAEAVGAAFYFATPEFGTTPPLLESFSSAGPTDILFDLTDTPILETRAKPEIVAPDGGNTTFFGSDIPDPGDGSDSDTFPNFFGTSAAAPHAAGAAALMKELAPNLAPSAIYQVLEASAIDMGAAGFDDDSGFGLIRALEATETVAPSASDCGVDDLVLEGTPNSGAQTFRACNSITWKEGLFDDITGLAPEHIFADGFESGDTSSWSASSP